jgi:predicted NAD-dependent protein-ADP-ribosyltransferase YbiA (DUF1768 family)
MGALLSFLREARLLRSPGIEMSVRLTGEDERAGLDLLAHSSSFSSPALLETWLRIADSVVVYDGSDDELWGMGEGGADAVAVEGGEGVSLLAPFARGSMAR